MDRRRFLELGGAVVAGGSFIAPRVSADLRPRWAPDTAVRGPASAWRQLSAGLKGTLVRPGDAGYLSLARPNNLRYKNILPKGIALCEDASDVSFCLRWAEQQGVPIITRGGGHSYAGYSCTHGLMIHLKNLNDAGFDARSKTVTIGGGIRNGAVYSALKSVGRSITHGRCPTVGAGGFLLGGGIGFDMRQNGFSSNKLVSTELVLANGEIVTADAQTNADLFWACRGGGGGNFGVNTSFTLETFPVDRCIEISLTWKDASDLLLQALFLHLENAPNELGTKVTLSSGFAARGQKVPVHVEVIGQFVGPLEPLQALLAPVFAVRQPTSSVMQEVPYWDASAFLSETGGAAYYQERSRFMNTPMTPELIRISRKWLSRWCPPAGQGIIKFFQTGGNTQAMGPTDTAFVHRRSVWLASIEISWPATIAPVNLFLAHRWQNDFYRDVVPLCGGGAFQNFVDPSLRDWANAYYGENLNRLQAIKTQVDPLNVFHFGQSIPPLT